MKPLIPQTVYVPTKIISANAHFFTSDDGGSGYLEEKADQFIFTKEDLIELLTDAFDEGYNGGWCMSREDTSDPDTIYDAQTFINNLLNQQ